MADIIDKANQELERSYDRGVINCTHQFSQPSEKECIDCGGDIPDVRQALGGVKRCVDCQDFYERKQN